jgi:RNA polymerase sigma-70 factor (ECF subfamily)
MDGVENETLTQTRTPTTRKSLLDDLAQNPDSERLAEFARLYEPVMRRYAMRAQARLRNGLSEADRDDLVQEAFISVRRALAQFRYDPSKGKFRNYLSLTIRNLAYRFQKRARISRPTDPDAVAALADSMAGAAGAGADNETRDLMLAIWSVAYARLVSRRGFTPNTMAIFRSHVLEGLPADEVAEEFKTSANAVYQIKDRILRAVRAEIASAQPPDGGLPELYEELLRRSEADAESRKR